MRHPIPVVDWTTALADAIESAQSGDIVEVHSVDMQKIAEFMHHSRYPDKNLIFEISLSDTATTEDPEEEGPWWAHGTKETNPYWPYEGPAQGWIHA